MDLLQFSFTKSFVNGLLKFETVVLKRVVGEYKITPFSFYCAVSPFTVAPVSMLEVNTNTIAEASLTCQSSGNPQPSIFWFTKAGPLESCNSRDEPIGEADIDFSIYFENFAESNTSFPDGNEGSNAGVIDACEIQTTTSTSPTGLSTTISTLIIDNLYQEQSMLIVCVADNGLPNMNSTQEAAGINLVLDSEFVMVIQIFRLRFPSPTSSLSLFLSFWWGNLSVS